jgi:hypothetical protein
MKNKSRRYEVLLPVRFNDGRDVPKDLLAVADLVHFEKRNRQALGRGRWLARLRPARQLFGETTVQLLRR